MRVNNWSEDYCSDPKSCKWTAALPSRFPVSFNQTISQIQKVLFGRDQHPLSKTSIMLQMTLAFIRNSLPNDVCWTTLLWNSWSKALYTDTFHELPYILKSSDKIKTLSFWLFPVLVHAVWLSSVKVNSWWHFFFLWKKENSNKTHEQTNNTTNLGVQRKKSVSCAVVQHQSSLRRGYNSKPMQCSTKMN